MLELVSSKVMHLSITCPMCKHWAGMEYIPDIQSWIAIAPFCCDAMRNLDTPEWYKLVDQAIKEAL